MYEHMHKEQYNTQRANDVTRDRRASSERQVDVMAAILKVSDFVGRCVFT